MAITYGPIFGRLEEDRLRDLFYAAEKRALERVRLVLVEEFRAAALTFALEYPISTKAWEWHVPPMDRHG